MKRVGVGLVLGLIMVVVSIARAAVDFEAPFTDVGTQVWDVIVPVTLAVLVAFGAWLALRAGHVGMFLVIVVGLMMIFFTGALPDFITEAGLNWPF